MVRILVLAFVVVSLGSGCSLRKWWGEEPEKPAVVEMASTGPGCPGIERILHGDEAESERAFECWAKDLGGIWTQVSGREREKLTEKDLSILIRKGLLKLGADAGETRQKVFAIKRLMGMPQELTKQRLDEWFALFRVHRPVLRDLYHKLTVPGHYIGYDDLQNGATTAAAFLRQMNWTMASDELVENLLDVVTVTDKDAEKALLPAARVMINLLNSVCPTFIGDDVWETRGIAECLVKGAEHFQVGAPWFEFILNPVPASLTKNQIQNIMSALRGLGDTFDSWFQDRKLRPVSVQLWVKLSEAMNVRPPEEFVKSLDVVRRFNPESSGEFLHPTLFNKAFEVYRDYHERFLKGLPFYLNAANRRMCTDKAAQSWRDCVPSVLYDRAAMEKAHPVIKLMLRVKNINYGNKGSPLHGLQFARIMLFDSIAEQIIEGFADPEKSQSIKKRKFLFWRQSSAYDDGAEAAQFEDDGLVISADVGRGSNEVVQLIRVGLQGYDVVHTFILNMLHKLRGEPFERDSAVRQLRTLDQVALAKLITMTHDVLVLRTPKQRNEFEKLFSNLLSLAPGSTTYLDRRSITAIITLIDSLPDYRREYQSKFRNLKIPDARYPTDYLVSRQDFLKVMPVLLADTFPRTLSACMAFGFERSCKVAFDEIVPDAKIDPKVLSVGDRSLKLVYLSDLDLMTIIMAAVEGLLDNCDADRDGKLRWSLTDGADELDCGFVRAKDITKRLLQTGIIEDYQTHEDRIWLNGAMDLVNSLVVTRILGKTALAKGTTEYLTMNFISWLWHRKATMGSIYGLLADVADPDQARDAPKIKRRVNLKEKKVQAGKKGAIVPISDWEKAR